MSEAVEWMIHWEGGGQLYIWLWNIIHCKGKMGVWWCMTWAQLESIMTNSYYIYLSWITFQTVQIIRMKYNELQFGLRISSIEVSKQRLCIATSLLCQQQNMQQRNPSRSTSFPRANEFRAIPRKHPEAIIKASKRVLASLVPHTCCPWLQRN